MARLFVPKVALGADEVELSGDAHRHLARVLRLGAGDPVTVFDGAGTEIAAVIISTDRNATRLRLGERRTVVVAGPRVVLLQAIAKGEKMDWVVQKTTELGVAAIVPVITARTVAKTDPAGARLRRWRTIAQEAARQCGRADLPVIEDPRPLPAVLAALPEAGRRLVLWEGFQAGPVRPLRRALGENESSVTLLVGAEGGFEPGEITQAEAAGFAAVGLGPRILRSETAAIVAVALVQAALGGLD